MEWIVALVTGLLSAEKGIYALGWLIAIFLMYRNITGKETRDLAAEELRKKHDDELKLKREQFDADMKKARDDFDARIKEIVDQSSLDLKEMQARIGKLHEDYVTMLTQQSDKRIDDLKSVTDEYNKMSEIIVQTLDRITQSISKKRG